MESPYERPDVRALAELERVLRLLTEELAGWRRRSLRAEAELQDIKAHGGTSAAPELRQARERVAELEQENRDLRRRVEAARERLGVLASRLGFLEHDMEGGAT